MAEIGFLADENIPGKSVARLRQAGLDVRAVSEHHAGLSDRKVLQLAQQESRILLTQDRDFGHLPFKMGNSAAVGVVYFRVVPAYPAELADILLKLMDGPMSLPGMFSVCDRDCIRQRTL